MADFVGSCQVNISRLGFVASIYLDKNQGDIDMTRSHRLTRSFPRLLLPTLLSAALFGGLAPTAYADIVQPPTVLTVNITLDVFNDFAPGDGRCDTRPVIAGDQCNLRAALAESAALAGNERIILPEGTFKPLADKGSFEVKSCVSIEGAGVEKTFIDGDQIALTLIVVTATPACAPTTSFNNLTVQRAKSGGLVVGEGTNVVLNHVVVRDNQRNSGFGGGIANGGKLLIKDTTIDSNSNNARAGGIANTGTLTILRSTISNNMSENRGGGIVNAGTLVIEQSTLTGNRTRYNGGALLNNAGSTATLRNVTITGNEANSSQGMQISLTEGHGGGFSNSGQLTLLNSIVAANTNNRAFQTHVGNIAPDCEGTVSSLGYNFLGTLGDEGICTLAYAPNPGLLPATDKRGTLQAPLDPKLGSFTDNGGPTKTFRPLSDSPVVDNGAMAPANCGNLDQRSRPRPFDGNDDGTSRCDIGAVERVQPIVTKISPDVVVAGPKFDLLIDLTGSGFSATTVATWNGQPLATTFLNANKLQATVPADYLKQPVMAAIWATEAGDFPPTGLKFTVIAPLVINNEPVISALNPESVTAGGSSFTLTVNGSKFSPNAKVRWNGEPRPTVFVSDTRLEAKISASDIAEAGGAKISVDNVNPAGIAESATFLITKPQTISFAPLADKLTSDGPFTVTASASSGLPVTFAANGVCSIAQDEVTLEGVVGSCTITALQSGNDEWSAAKKVSRSFVVGELNKQSQTITFAAVPNRSFSEGAFELVATASSGLPVSFSASGACGMAGNTLVLDAPGTCAVTASQDGDATFNPAANVTHEFTITETVVQSPTATIFVPLVSR